MNNLRTEKLCSDCRAIKPLTEFYTRGKGANGYLYTSKCIPCAKAYKHRRAIDRGAKFPGRMILNAEGVVIGKECFSCRVEKPASEFFRARDRLKSRCKECLRASWLEQLANESPEQANFRRERQRIQHRKYAAYYREYRKKHKQREADYQAEWRRKNPGKHAEHEARRRLRMQAASMGDIDRQAIIERDRSTCYLCRKVLTATKIHLDHVIPLVRGGLHSPENIKVSCAPCNLSKHSKTPDELMPYTACT